VGGFVSRGSVGLPGQPILSTMGPVAWLLSFLRAAAALNKWNGDIPVNLDAEDSFSPDLQPSSHLYINHNRSFLRSSA
jgi:hypothetical protein